MALKDRGLELMSRFDDSFDGVGGRGVVRGLSSYLGESTLGEYTAE